MIVQCEQCLTRFRLDPSNIKGAQAKVRCSQCGHVFLISKPEYEESEPAPVAPARAVREPEYEEDEYEEAYASVRRKPRRRRASAGGGYGVWLKLAIFIIPILILAAGAAYYFFLRPHSGTPNKGPIKAQVDTSYKNIVLTAAEGYFKENQKAGTLFIIKGVAQNKNKQPVDFVKLRGILHDTNAKAVMERDVFAGNLFTEEELTDLPIEKIQERSQNQRGFNNANFNVPPGGSVPFMIVFDSIPKNLAEFTVKVVESSLHADSAS